MDHVRVNLLGLRVSALDLPRAVAVIRGWFETGPATPRYICIRDAHGVVRAQSDAEFKRIHNDAAMVTSDGMPLVWMLRRLGQPDARRVYGPDLMLAVVGDPLLAAKRHYFYGGAPGVAEKLIARLRATAPDLNVVGWRSPPFGDFDLATREAEGAVISASRPDFVWVGLGTPKQERWMALETPRLGIPVTVGVGAAFDFHAGLKPQAPAFMQRNGLEWAFRLASEPRRLWKRYLVTVPSFAWLAFLQLSGLKRFSED